MFPWNFELILSYLQFTLLINCHSHRLVRKLHTLNFSVKILITLICEILDANTFHIQRHQNYISSLENLFVVFLGYSPLHKEYWYLDLHTRHVYISCHVFNENIFPYSPQANSICTQTDHSSIITYPNLDEWFSRNTNDTSLLEDLSSMPLNLSY